MRKNIKGSQGVLLREKLKIKLLREKFKIKPNEKMHVAEPEKWVQYTGIS
jgi:hypothetical protein